MKNQTFLVQPDGAGSSRDTVSSPAPTAAPTAAELSFSTELAIFTCEFSPKIFHNTVENENTRNLNNN
jgi:hypothetical protein